jgi:hypothetical protein
MQLVNEVQQFEQELITPVEKRSTTPDLQVQSMANINQFHNALIFFNE